MLSFRPVLFALAISVSALSLNACDVITQNPHLQTIPTNSETWQDELSETLEALPAEERKLVSRYMLRMKLSEAYEAGALERVTIGEAIELQREYERLHPDNPTGKKSPIKIESNLTTAEQYPVTLLPIKTTTDDANTVTFRFVLSNMGEQAITDFAGKITIRSPDFKNATTFNVDPMNFNPPIAVGDAGKIPVVVELGDVNVMRAIKSANGVDVTLQQGQLTLEDGSQIEFHSQPSHN